MNQQYFESGYAAYQAGDWASAASYFQQAKDPGEVQGKLDHLRGNALMQMSRFAEAANAYGDALADPSYGMVGALCTNRGRALIACGKINEAVESLVTATQDKSYRTPYKAYMALGGAYRALGDTRNAGIAYRNAAIDESNPDPSVSLRKLGGCFMELGRPADAVESYRTALDFTSDAKGQNAIYCDLALAYVATNRMNEAVDAFDHALADGTFRLSPEAQASYDAARNAVAARAGERRVSDTDDFLAAAGYGQYPVDPLDPTGETSGNLMPSPEDTGFFSISEEEIVDGDRRSRKGRGGKVAIVIIIILLLLAAAGGFAYYQGFGWPMQENVVQSVFDARTKGDDLGKYLASSLNDENRKQIEVLIPKDATISITGVERSMNNSKVSVSAKLAAGGERSYDVKLVRDGIGWKISEFVPAFVATDANAVASNSNSAAAHNNSNSTQSQPEAQPDAGNSEGTQPAGDDAVMTEGEVAAE